jgi:hypothetical protein
MNQIANATQQHGGGSGSGPGGKLVCLRSEYGLAHSLKVLRRPEIHSPIRMRCPP